MSKKIEAEGFKHLERDIKTHLKGATLESTMNKGRGKSLGIADAVLKYNGEIVHIEIKASSKTLGTNIRFTHQTISKTIGHDLVVALITNLANPADINIQFFRLGAVQKSIVVEPHFIVQAKSIKSSVSTLPELLQSKSITLSLSELLNTKVGQHIANSAV